MITSTSSDRQPSNCSTCPYFKSFGPNERDRGLCRAFDRVAWGRHQKTNDCDLEIQEIEKYQETSSAIAPQPEDNEQPAIEVDSPDGIEYRVWQGMTLVGTFHQSPTDRRWITHPALGRDFNRYQSDGDAIAALAQHWQKTQAIRLLDAAALSLLH